MQISGWEWTEFTFEPQSPVVFKVTGVQNMASGTFPTCYNNHRSVAFIESILTLLDFNCIDFNTSEQMQRHINL